MKPILSLFKVQDRSMEPIYRSGDYILSSRIHSGLKPGDVIVLRHPANQMKLVKRISSIAEGKLFVMGDNREESQDSRRFGAIDKEEVLGKVLLKI